MEAVAKEVALLRSAFPGSSAWGVTAHRILRYERSSGLAMHPRLHWAFRALTSVLQRRFDINHLFGGAGDWFHLRAARKRPIVLTVALDAEPCAAEMLAKVDRFAVEWPQAKARLEALGIPAERIEVIYPPVNLRDYSVQPLPESPFTVLFASSPDRADWLDARGVPILLEAAKLRPQVRFILCWRPWGNARAVVERTIAANRLGNVEVRTGVFRDMAALYREVHATVFCATDPRRCKPVPNSLVESLACGRPVLLTRVCGLAPLIETHGGGVVVEPTAAGLAAGIDRVAASGRAFGDAARRLAEDAFDAERFVQQYRQLYEAVQGSGAASPTGVSSRASTPGCRVT